MTVAWQTVAWATVVKSDGVVIKPGCYSVKDHKLIFIDHMEICGAWG
jgi:hypothetical protein